MLPNPHAAAFSCPHPPECQGCIDAVLCSLAFRYLDSADHFLDLKLDVSARKNPGRCVRVYFWLVDRLPGSCREELNQIREWLERSIEIKAFKSPGILFGELPLYLKVDSLEQCCHWAMNHFRRATAETPVDLELRFAYR